MARNNNAKGIARVGFMENNRIGRQDILISNHGKFHDRLARDFLKKVRRGENVGPLVIQKAFVQLASDKVTE